VFRLVSVSCVAPFFQGGVLQGEGPGVMMQKLCGFKLSHAEKTPDDPAGAKHTWISCCARVVSRMQNDQFDKTGSGRAHRRLKGKMGRAFVYLFAQSGSQWVQRASPSS
jgi:hypothetical protein